MDEFNDFIEEEDDTPKIPPNSSFVVLIPYTLGGRGYIDHPNSGEEVEN